MIAMQKRVTNILKKSKSFLDKYLVQEFLWLDSTLKNSKYKSSLDEYLRINNFPFASGQKIGFNTLKDLPRLDELTELIDKDINSN